MSFAEELKKMTPEELLTEAAVYSKRFDLAAAQLAKLQVHPNMHPVQGLLETMRIGSALEQICRDTGTIYTEIADRYQVIIATSQHLLMNGPLR